MKYIKKTIVPNHFGRYYTPVSNVITTKVDTKSTSSTEYYGMSINGLLAAIWHYKCSG